MVQVATLRFGLGCKALSTIVVGIGAPDHFEQVLAAVANGPLDTLAHTKIAELWHRDPAFIE